MKTMTKETLQERIDNLRKRGTVVSVKAENSVPPDVTRALGEFTAALAEFKTAQASAAAEVRALATTSETTAKTALEKAAAAAETAEKAAANLVELEQKIADKITSGRYVPAASVGQIVTESAEYKAVVAGLQGGRPQNGFKLTVEANTITGQTGSPAVNDDTLVPTMRRPGIIPGAFRALRIRELLSMIPTTSNLYQFTRELAFTNNAAETAEGAAKPESVLTFEQAEVAIRTIAHFIKASNQILADAPALRAYIDGRLRFGVDAREDAQLVSGAGTGQNISGMTTSGNYTAFTPTTGETALDSLNRAKYAILASDWAADGVVMTPAVWSAIERLKTDNAEYLIGDPFGQIVPIVWGLPVALSNNMVANKFLMADFATSYDYVSRQSTVVDIGYVNDDFTKNLVTIRGEKRSALATIRPASTRYGSLTI